jgi:hypothetical protein
MNQERVDERNLVSNIHVLSEHKGALYTRKSNQKVKGYRPIKVGLQVMASQYVSEGK